MAAELVLADVTSGYGPMHVLKNVELKLTRGERLSIIGRNGAGKTTLLLTIMGLCRLHGGEISLAGARISSMPTWQRAHLGLGLVPQTRNIFGSLTVEENLLAGLKSSRDSDIDYAYDLFPRLKERRGNLGGQLSGGEQQMLSIARTLLGRPKFLLLDEPLEGLAPIICEELLEVFGRLAAEGPELAIVLVEQHLQVALEFAQRAVLLDRGSIAFDGAVSDLRATQLLEQKLGLSAAGVAK